MSKLLENAIIHIIPDGTKVVTKDLVKKADIYILPASIEEIAEDAFDVEDYPWTFQYTGTIEQFKKIKLSKYMQYCPCIKCADGTNIQHL